LEIKKAMGLIGGSWKGGKIAGFQFKTDPSDLLNKIAEREEDIMKGNILESNSVLKYSLSSS
jgi:hypothetical protein